MPYFEDVRVSDSLPEYKKGPVTRQHLVEWCAAENDYYDLHYDDRIAAGMQLAGPPIQGTYRYALMGQAIDRWLGGKGRLVRIAASYRALNLEGETLTISGRIAKLEAGDGEGIAELEFVLRGGDKPPSTTGTARVVLPMRRV